MNDNLKRKAQKLLDNKGNEFLTQLEATLDVVDKLDSVVEAVKSIPETVIPNYPEFPDSLSVNNFPEVQTIRIEGLSTITLKGDKGDKGDKGEKGDAGRDGLNGLDGITPIKGVDYFDGKDGKDGLPGKDGTNGSPDTGTEIVDKINSKENIRKISLSKIEGIEKLGGNRIISSGVNSITAGANVTVTSSQGNGKGDITISATGGSGGSPSGPSGSLQYNDGAGGFAGSSAVVYDQGSNNFLLTTREYITINNATPATLTNPTLQATNTLDEYTQISIQNKNSGANASADIIAYPNNITDDINGGWMDMGITSSGFNDVEYMVTGANEGYIFMSAPDASGTTGNMVIATDSTGTANEIVFHTGGFTDATANERLRIKSSSTTTPNDIEITSSSTGLILKSPNGTRWRIGITNNGELTATSL